jgi:hypothetical protein
VTKPLKFVGSTALGIVVGLYATFVLQMLWNWFATQAFHVESIGYWNMCGLLLIASLVKARNKDTGEILFEIKVTTMLEAYLPEEKRAETMRQLEEGEIAEMFRPTAIDGMKALGSRFFSSSASWFIRFLRRWADLT